MNVNDLDPAVLDVLERHYPATLRSPDWPDVLGRSAARPRRRWRMVALVAAVLVGVAVPAFALSASVRGLLGFPQPVLAKARLMVSTPIADGRILRVWESPSDTGGVCWFSTAERSDTDQRPAHMGGGGCSTSGDFHALHAGLLLQASVATQARTANWVPPTVSGWLNPKLHATRVELRSRTGAALPLAYANNYFVGVSATLFRPSFDNLPYHVVAYDSRGREVARQKIGSYSFYLTPKKILDRTLRPYVRAHPGRHIM